MEKRQIFATSGILLGSLLLSLAANAQDTSSPNTEDVLAGHSYHGEAFNEGPRQQAYLMPGLGRTKFGVSTENEQAKKFFRQGIDQLHGFWYFEAERSFRQVQVLDPSCAMAYWGLAMANVNNADRAKKFILQAGEKAANKKRATTDREKLYIQALAAFYDEDVSDDKKRAGNFADKLGTIVLTYPDDIEAKAFLVRQLWMNQSKIPISSHVAVNALLDQVFAVDPMHPAHHYRIHLWDDKNAKIALQSAAKCGPTLPDIAHMWHMPGHIYSKLKRYEDAVWQQEASARVDHRHIMHDQILPDQIHNFAHNNEWCVRNLNHVGRVRDAIDLATNMISMPRHPKYNHLTNQGSAWYGRQRLFETFSRYELWQELIDGCESAVLETTDDSKQQIKRLRFLGRAYFRSDNSIDGERILQELSDELASLESVIQDAEAKATTKEQRRTKSYFHLLDLVELLIPAKVFEKFKTKLKIAIRKDHRTRLDKAVKQVGADARMRKHIVNRAIWELQGYQLVDEQKYSEALEKFRESGEVDAIYRASILRLTGDTDKAVVDARKYVKSHKNEVQPLANLAWLLWQADQKDEAKTAFEELLSISGSIDMNSPVFTRLNVVSDHCGVSGDWRSKKSVAADIGEHPDFDTLGPFRWQPVNAPDWELVDSVGQTISMKQFQGKPVIVIFYLGHGCLHCAEQLQKFAPMMDKYQRQGIEMVAISTDEREGLTQSIDSYGGLPLPIQLLANPDYSVFRQYRVFDEFENQPLHGTFLIDGSGKILWQDISYEPFMEPEFLLKESVRLLSQ